MDHHTNYVVKLNTDSKHKSLYKWCLQEFDGDGEQVGEDLVHCNNSFYFDVTNMSYQYSLNTPYQSGSLTKSINIESEILEGTYTAETTDPDLLLKGEEIISAVLIPENRGTYRTTSYSMIGTNRKIREINLEIIKSEQDNFHVWGTVGYTSPVNFKEKEDVIQVVLALAPERFEELARMINSFGANKGWLRLSGVLGFYSRWSHDSSSSYIKVLTRDGVPRINALESTIIKPPKLGQVGGFDFRLFNNHEFKYESRVDVNSLNFEWAKEQTEKHFSWLFRDLEDTDSEDENLPKKKLGGFNEERAKSLRFSRKYKLMSEMYAEAASYVEQKNLGSEALEDLSEKIDHFFVSLDGFLPRKKINQDSPESITEGMLQQCKMWQGQVNYDEIKKGKAPQINRFELSECVVIYLALPIRNKGIERMLVDALVAVEAISYGEEMLIDPGSGLLKSLSRSPLVKSHPLMPFLKTNAINLISLLLLPFVLTFLATQLFNLSDAWTLFVGLGALSLWAFFLLIGLFALPNSIISYSKARSKTLEQLVDMQVVHREIRTGLVISARHIRARLEKISEKGVIWPAEIYPLLDDIIARGGSI